MMCAVGRGRRRRRRRRGDFSHLPQLRRHVARRPQLIPHRHRAALHLHREAKIDELELAVVAVLLVHDVVELDVAVDDAVVVAVDDRREGLLDDRRGHALGVAVAVLAHARDERAAGAELHHDVHHAVPLVLERLDDARDVRVVEPLLYVELDQQFVKVRAAHRLERDRLHREHIVRVLPAHRDHRAARAAPELRRLARVVLLVHLRDVRAVDEARRECCVLIIDVGRVRHLFRHPLWLLLNFHAVDFDGL